MVTTALERAAAVLQPLDHHERRVEQRDAQHEQRHEQRHDRGRVHELDAGGGDREQEAEEEAASVTM